MGACFKPNRRWRRLARLCGTGEGRDGVRDTRSIYLTPYKTYGCMIQVNVRETGPVCVAPEKAREV